MHIVQINALKLLYFKFKGYGLLYKQSMQNAYKWVKYKLEFVSLNSECLLKFGKHADGRNMWPLYVGLKQG